MSQRLDQRSHDANQADSAFGRDDFLGITYQLGRECFGNHARSSRARVKNDKNLSCRHFCTFCFCAGRGVLCLVRHCSLHYLSSGASIRRSIVLIVRQAGHRTQVNQRHAAIAKSWKPTALRPSMRSVLLQICFMGISWARPRAHQANILISMVGGSGIEPLTPSMSRKCSSAELTAR